MEVRKSSPRPDLTLNHGGRPISSYGALDLPTYFLDLTPFVPVLADGKTHTITLDVASAEDDHTINQNWFISGSLQVVTDPSSKPTSGKITSYTADPYAKSTVTGNVAANGDVDITVKATRHIHIEADIVSGSGKQTHVVWSQNLEYSNVQYYLKNTSVQVGCSPSACTTAHSGQQNVAQTASGAVLSTHNGANAVLDSFSYPLNINLTILSPDGKTCELLYWVYPSVLTFANSPGTI